MNKHPLASFSVKALVAATALVFASHVSAVTPEVAAKVGYSTTQSLKTAPKDNIRLIVKYRQGSQAQRAMRLASGQQNAVRYSGMATRFIRTISSGADVVEVDGASSASQATQVMEAMAANPDVEFVEVDQLMKPTLTPNDQYYDQYQWHYRDAPGGIRADQAWDITSGAGVVVAVLDTGITQHSDLNANVLPGYDFVSDAARARDGNGRDGDASDEGDWYRDWACGGRPEPRLEKADSSWHGTHVAGTIGAVTNNRTGVAGVAHSARILPVRVLAQCGGYTSDIADAIVWASGGSVSGVPVNNNPADVINMSLGGQGGCSRTYQNAINTAVNRGTLVVVAAGNDNDNVSGYVPGNCNNVVSVASTTQQGERSYFSNYGSLIDVAAPGSDIASTVNRGTTSPAAESYSLMSGTSMASPHVAGVAALALSAAAENNRSLSPAQLEQLLKDNVTSFPSTPSRSIGTGIVDAKAVVDAARGSSNGGGDGVLTNGTSESVSGSRGSQAFWTIEVPANARNLSIRLSGGSGDADLYVKAGSKPTTSSFDCRSWRSGNSETCSFSSPSADTYHVMLNAYSTFSGASLVATYETGSSGGGVQTYTNNSNVTIVDYRTVESAISVLGRSGNAPSSTKVTVDVKHTYRGDLRLNLIAPDGSTYPIEHSGGSGDNIIGSINLDLSSETINGTWKLSVYDRYAGDTGYIDSWSITF